MAGCQLARRVLSQPENDLVAMQPIKLLQQTYEAKGPGSTANSHNA